MSVKLVSLLSFLVLIVSSVLAGQERSAFEFINGLQGSRKGDKTQGVLGLKHYMERFGYLNYDSSAPHAEDDEFDDLLEEAVKTYQRNYNLEVTGTLDSETVSQMAKPRCGVPDIIDGTNTMRVGRKMSHHGHGFLHTVGHYSFFQGSPKWPSTKYRLTYAFLNGTRTDAFAPVIRAFQKWDNATHFNFTQVPIGSTSDLKISFANRSHGDGNAFDGPGGVIAHAFAPTSGVLHYDGEERYSDGATSGAFDLETIALHEIGHLLGLGHSQVVAAIMYPSVSTGVTKGLNADDIQGIKALYGM